MNADESPAGRPAQDDAGDRQQAGHSADGPSVADGSSVEVTVTYDTSGSAHKSGSEKLYLMRDSKDPDGPVLAFTPAEWEAFVLGVKDGEFDIAP